jgi:calcineurin-like phosphoesterase family protein
MLFFTANTFFNHRGMLKYRNRPFETVQEMNAHLIQEWNSVVGVDDVVHHLGNFGFGSVSTLQAIRSSLHGAIYLTPGPHDAPSYSVRKRIGFCRGQLPSVTIANGLACRLQVHYSHRPRARYCEATEFVELDDAFFCDAPSPLDSLEVPLYVGISGHDTTAWRGRISKKALTSTFAKEGYHEMQINVDFDDWKFRPVSSDVLLNIVNRWAASTNQRRIDNPCLEIPVDTTPRTARTVSTGSNGLLINNTPYAVETSTTQFVWTRSGT